VNCATCGTQLRADAGICLACGEVVRRKLGPAERVQTAPAGVPAWIAFERRASEETHLGAGRIERLMAALVDAVLMGLVVAVLSAFLGRPEVEVSDRSYSAPWLLLLPFLAVEAAYYVTFPATRWRGTPGKRLLGLQITDLDGQQITIFQSAMRFVFQQAWLWVGVPLTLIGASNSPWAGIVPFAAVIAVVVAFWMLCANGRSPWDWMAGTKVVD
jgi:uncharacterized RDD family membrane protein YckC